MKVYIIEDDPIQVETLQHILEEADIESASSCSGENIVSKVSEYDPDLILLDIILPDLNGYKVCEQLSCCRTTHNIPIIAVSSLNSEYDKLKILAKGCVDYIKKPFTANNLLSKVSRYSKIGQIYKVANKMYNY